MNTAIKPGVTNAYDLVQVVREEVIYAEYDLEELAWMQIRINIGLEICSYLKDGIKYVPGFGKHSDSARSIAKVLVEDGWLSGNIVV